MFGDQMKFMVPDSNPAERARVNAVNSRLKSANGEIRMMVNPKAAPNIVRDFEGVRLLEGGSGELDKDADEGKLSHLTDAIGYYIQYKFPILNAIGQRSF